MAHLSFSPIARRYAALIGKLIFFIAALDTPYGGEFSAGPDAFQLVLERMKKM